LSYKILEQIASNEFKNRFWWWIEVGCRFKICFESGANQITGGALLKKTELFLKNGLLNMEQIKSF
jgi:hypothetical protein